MPYEVPVEISQKLQNQIIHLCKQVPHDEWSGVLFYRTEGNIEDRTLRCFAEEVFLMDIGSPGYTEYDYGDAALVKYLMENKHVLKMVKGHIHSHNSMSVFFSGTDTDELYGNCKHHNMYLSLIVNNHNDMVARIAYQAVEKSVTLEFRNSGGETQTRVVDSNQELVFEHKCKIILPGGIPIDDMEGRISSLKSSRSSYRSQVSSWEPEGRSPGFHLESTQKKSLTGSEVPKGVYEFLVAVFTGNEKSRSALTTVLKGMDELMDRDPAAFNVLLDQIKDRIPEMYEKTSFRSEDFTSKMEMSVQTLRAYADSYPDLVRDLTRDVFEKVKYGSRKFNNRVWD